MSGAAIPAWAYVGKSPIRVVAPPIVNRVIMSTVRRPSLSA